ncbi:uncharacterized protein LOC132759963 [Ruditapes philippinarum]|uniref:uncharacterized protein LOC132759963 n=1 Tax=Ruditapes philippinarum TaxID=129788 RepID=UPI00295BD38A|nr:uncharacterized protein LOC132759963 [Ruditapes philippinarum]
MNFKLLLYTVLVSLQSKETENTSDSDNLTSLNIGETFSTNINFVFASNGNFTDIFHEVHFHLQHTCRNKFLRPRNTLRFLILLAGDIQVNPGPIRNPCFKCCRPIASTHRNVKCVTCNHKWHIKCQQISPREFTSLYSNLESWMCNACSKLSLSKEIPSADEIHNSSNSHVINSKGVNSSNLESNQQHQNVSSTIRDSCENINCFERKGLHFIHFNVCSLLPKMSELRQIATKFKFSAIAITESWLDNSVTDNEVIIQGYNVIRKDRNRSGGGVCLYIHEDLAFTERQDLETEHLEIVWADLLLPKTKPILINSCYRPPKQSYVDFLNMFETVLSKIRSDTECFFLGDLNIDWLDKTSSVFMKYECVLKIFNLTQIIKEPTRITLNTKTLIDHILCSHSDKVFQSGTLPIGLSDHLPVYCTRKLQKGTFNKHKNIIIRSMKNYSAEIFIHNLKLCDWSSMFTAKSVDESWLLFKDMFLSVLNVVAPVKEVRLKQRSEPWLDSNILELINMRDYFLQEFRKHNQKDMYNKYCLYRNLIQRHIKKAKSGYISHQLQENKYNPKKLWSQLKDLGYSKKTKSSPNIVLNIDDENCFEPTKIACHFNQFFTTVASVLVDKLPNPFNLFSVESDIFKEFYKNRNPDGNKFQLHTVSEEYIYKELCKLNCSKSTGLDEIPAKFLKDAAPFLKIHITFLVNNSITSKSVPNELKCAKVKPLFKKNNRSDVSNYRPVSILSIVSKILERTVYNQLEIFLVKQGLLYELQSGFRCNYSTDSCLIHLTDHVKSQTSKGLLTGMIMLDLQKAFDTVTMTSCVESYKKWVWSQ